MNTERSTGDHTQHPMRVVLYNPVSNATGKRMLPMSLLALGAVLEGKHDYRIIDGNCENDALARLREAIHAGCDVLGVTLMPGPQLADAVPICRALDAEFPDLKIVWGGYFPTQHSQVALRDPAIDFVVRGHGELVFLQLLDALAAGRPCSGIPGLSCRDGMGEIIANPLAAVPHPEHLPEYPYQRLEMRRYVRPTFLGSRTLAHHSSYGCPFRCNFCAVVNMVDGRWLAQSPRRVAAIAKRYVDEWGVNALEFYDSNFFAQEGRTAEIAERLSPLSLAWWGEARIDTLLKYSDSTWRAMQQSGLKMVFMGAESASLETLQRMRKGGTVTPEKTMAIVAKMSEHSIIPELSFILGNPPDAESDIRGTLEFVRRVKRINPATEIVLYLYTPEPLAGDLYEAATATGFRFPSTLDEWVNERWKQFAQRHSDVMPWLKPATRRRIQNFQRVLNAYYPTTTDEALSSLHRRILRGVSAWRYHSGFYHFPVELRIAQKLFSYQRPETAGF